MAKAVIESGVPIPEKWDCLRKYDWQQMKVGDSFKRPIGMWGAVRASAWKAAKTFGFKFTIRRTGKLVRCWRIE